MTQQEFSNLTSGMRAKLLSLAGSFSRNSGAAMGAEDIVQETLLTLWELYRQGYPILNPEPLAVKILKTKCVAEYRKRRVEVRPLESVSNWAGGEHATLLMERQEAEAMEQRLMSQLSQTQRDLLRMRGTQGLSLDEIAEVTGKPKTSVKTTLSAARKKLLQLIQTKHYD
ncbi:MAG: sigma-70 family RNA polymerase sigma factor [Bacteroidaceae bacterium]|nr:sigma-70 family RNA polymerase sigma factor [Bacteroidaceae bacterium]